MQQLELVSYTEGEVAGSGWALYIRRPEVAGFSYEVPALQSAGGAGTIGVQGQLVQGELMQGPVAAERGPLIYLRPR